MTSTDKICVVFRCTKIIANPLSLSSVIEAKSAGHYNQQKNLLLVEEPLHQPLHQPLHSTWVLKTFSDGHLGPLITYLGDPKKMTASAAACMLLSCCISRLLNNLHL